MFISLSALLAVVCLLPAVAKLQKPCGNAGGRRALRRAVGSLPAHRRGRARRRRGVLVGLRFVALGLAAAGGGGPSARRSAGDTPSRGRQPPARGARGRRSGDQPRLRHRRAGSDDRPNAEGRALAQGAWLRWRLVGQVRLPATDKELWEFVEARALPLVLTRLSDFTIQAATEAALAEVDLSLDDVLHHPVFDLLDANERPRTREALQALADGSSIDFFRTYQPLSRARTREAGVYVWSHTISFGPRRYALTEIRAAEAPTTSPLVESLGYEPYVFAIGVVDRFGIITSVSNDVSEVIGVTADEVLGHSLLPLDKEEFWSRLHSSTDPRTVLSI